MKNRAVKKEAYPITMCIAGCCHRIACARIHSGSIHATKGCRKVTLRTLRNRSTESGLAHESSPRGW